MTRVVASLPVLLAAALAVAAPITSVPWNALGDAWKANSITPVGAASDEEFLRRVYLDLTGRIPSRTQARAFLERQNGQKRVLLVDQLLHTPEHAEYAASRLSDVLLQGQSRLKTPARSAFEEALAKEIANNTPYDVLVRKLLTVEGSSTDHPEAAFLFAHGQGGGGPQAVAAATSRAFLGLQLQCAQCHDHPFDARYKQEDFHALAAFFSQSRAKREKDDGVKAVMIMDTMKGQLRMKRPNGEEVVVKPSFLGKPFPSLPGETRRQTGARAITTSDLFAKALVNRLWADLMGRGLVQPFDDLGGENDAAHPPLLIGLAQHFRDSGHDLRALYRMLVLSPAYNRSSVLRDVGNVEAAKLETHFARAPVRPLNAFQLFESQLQATGIQDAVMERQGPEQAGKMRQNAAREFTFIFGDDEGGEVDAFHGNVPQALLAFNGDLVNRGSRAGPALVLGHILAEKPAQRDRIEEMYLATLSRRPTSAETERAVSLMTQHTGKPREALEDLYFALLASTEFSTNH